MDVKKSSAKADPVDQAVAEIKRGTDRLIRLLASEDLAIGARADAALRALDPPPIGPLAEALFTARDPKVRAGAAAVLGSAADADKLRVLVILGHAFKAEADMAVRLAIVDAMLGMKTFFEELQEAAAAGPGGPSAAVPGPG